MAAGHRAVDGIGDMLDADGGIGQIDDEHARPLIRLGHHNAHLGPLRAGDEALAAIDDPVIAITLAGGFHHRGI